MSGNTTLVEDRVTLLSIARKLGQSEAWVKRSFALVSFVHHLHPLPDGAGLMTVKGYRVTTLA